MRIPGCGGMGDTRSVLVRTPTRVQPRPPVPRSVNCGFSEAWACINTSAAPEKWTIWPTGAHGTGLHKQLDLWTYNHPAGGDSPPKVKVKVNRKVTIFAKIALAPTAIFAKSGPKTAQKWRKVNESEWKWILPWVATHGYPKKPLFEKKPVLGFVQKDVFLKKGYFRPSVGSYPW